jgi:hypothetical protein
LYHSVAAGSPVPGLSAGARAASVAAGLQLTRLKTRRTVIAISASHPNFLFVNLFAPPVDNENPVGNFLPRSKIVFHYPNFKLNALLSHADVA